MESALVACEEVSEAAVVGFPHELKGEGIGCYVILRQGYSPDPALTKYVLLLVLLSSRSNTTSVTTITIINTFTATTTTSSVSTIYYYYSCYSSYYITVS